MGRLVLVYINLSMFDHPIVEVRQKIGQPNPNLIAESIYQ